MREQFEDTFDLAHWSSVFPIESLEADYNVRVDGYRVTSPVHLAVIEQIRTLYQDKLMRREKAPTRVFIFGKGEGTHRHNTKIGGLPYRPRTRPWPTSREGLPLTFVAQFCFASVPFELPQLPGDVLLVFGREELPIYGDAAAFFYEWFPLGLDDLATSDEVPRTDWYVKPFFAVAHNSWDYTEKWTGALFQNFQCPWRIVRFEATKIGGEPTYARGLRRLPGHYLCTIGTLSYAGNCPFPWINQEEPEIIDWATIQDLEVFLQWADGGFVNYFLTEDGTINWQLHSY
jgi:hypothetical protein